MSTPLSTDERRIVAALERWAKAYDAAYATNPFSFNLIRARVCRKIARAISEGKHR